jgi:hypothetical protein
MAEASKIAAVVAAIAAYQERTDTLPARVLVPIGWSEALCGEMEDRLGNKPCPTSTLRVLGVRVEESADVVGVVVSDG